MAQISNIHVGLSAWAASTSYAVGTRVYNGSNVYQVITTGTSAASGGPSGTSSSIQDNSVFWQFLSSYDYSSLTSWAAAIPTSLTQDVVGRVWNNGTITTTAGTPFVTLSGHTMNGHTITITPAPGEGIADSLRTGTVPLAFNPAYGVSFTIPTASSSISYFSIQDANVILDGLQILNSSSSNGSTFLQTYLDGCTLRNCIIDCYTQSSGPVAYLGGGTKVYNCLWIDRSTTGTFNSTLSLPVSTCSLANCTFIAPNGATQAFYSAVSVTNCAIFGYATAGAGSAAITATNCGISNSAFGTNVTPVNCLFSLSAAAQFNSATSDFRLQPIALTQVGSINDTSVTNTSLILNWTPPTFTSISPPQGVTASGVSGNSVTLSWTAPTISTPSLINAGIADPTDVPTFTDIVGTARPQGGLWDIGCYEYSLSAPASGMATFLTFRATGQSAIKVPSSGLSYLEPITGYGQLVQVQGITGRSTIFVLRSTGTANQYDLANGTGQFLPVSVTSAGILTLPAQSRNTVLPFQIQAQVQFFATNGISTILSLSSVVTVTQSSVQGRVSFFNLTTQALLTQPLLAGQVTILPITASGFIPLQPLFGISNILAIGSLAYVQPQISISTILNLSAQATATVTTIDPAQATNTILALTTAAGSGAKQLVSAQGNALVLPLTIQASFISKVRLSAVASVLGLSASGTLGQTAHGTNTLLQITCHASTLLSSNAFASTELFDIGLQGPIIQPVLTEDGTVINIDPAPGQPLVADTYFYNFYQQVLSQSLARMAVITAQGAAIPSYAVQSTTSVFGISNTASAQQTTPAQALITVLALGSQAAMRQLPTNALGTALTLRASGNVQSSVAAAGANNLLSLRTNGATATSTMLSGRSTVLPLSIRLAAGLFNNATGLTRVATTSTSAQAVLRAVGSAQAVIEPVSFAGTATLSQPATQSSGVLSLTPAATAALSNSARGSGRLYYYSSGFLGIPNKAIGVASLSFSTLGTVSVNTPAFATSALSINSRGTAVLNTPTAGTATIVYTSAGTAVFGNGAVANVTLPGLTAAGSATVVAGDLWGVVTLPALRASAVIGGAVTAQTAANIDFSVGRYATIFQSRIGWTPGDQVVYWSE